MKKILCFVFVVWCMNLYSQSNNNFTINDSKVIWQRVFETQLTQGDIIKAMKNSGSFANIDTIDGRINAEIKPYQPNYERAGFTKFVTPYHLSGGNVYAFIAIELKEGKYRATIKNIKVKSTNVNAMTYTTYDTDNGIEFYAIKKLQFTTRFLNNDAKILDSDFFYLCYFKKSDNW